MSGEGRSGHADYVAGQCLSVSRRYYEGGSVYSNQAQIVECSWAGLQRALQAETGLRYEVPPWISGLRGLYLRRGIPSLVLNKRNIHPSVAGQWYQGVGGDC